MATDTPARALTIRQPWTDAILLAGKGAENRAWTTTYRGWPAIHAGMTIDPPTRPDPHARRAPTAQQVENLPRLGADAMPQADIRVTFGQPAMPDVDT